MNRTVMNLIGAAVVALTAGGAQAQVALEMEGPITGYSGNGPGVRPTLEVMGVPVTIERGTVLNSPTTTRADTGLNIGQWFRGDRFPGRAQRGFIGGTAIVTGTVTADGAISAAEVFTEPAENVVLGVISSATCATALCDTPGEAITALASTASPGVQLLALTQAGTNGRMAFGGAVSDLGFEVDLSAAPLEGFPLAAEGYYSERDTGVPTLYYFALEVTDGGALLANPDVTEIVATRAQCRQTDVNEFQLEVRGSTHLPAAQNGVGDPTSGVVGLRFNDDPAEQLVAAEVPVIDAAAEAGDPLNIFGGFRIRIDRTVGSCPTSIVLSLTGSDGQTAPLILSPAFDVDIRDDTAG